MTLTMNLLPRRLSDLERWLRRDFGWRPTIVMRKRLVTGEVEAGPLMERRIAGEMQYRRMTGAERADWDAEAAW
jgi:hypothetical protein